MNSLRPWILRSSQRTGEQVFPGGSVVSPVSGRYIIRKKIATGGVGELYLADEVFASGERRPVVIKKTLPHLVGELDYTLEREARILAVLTHSNIIRLYDLSKDASGALFMVMEYVDGKNLKEVGELLTTHDIILPLPAFYYIGEQILRGLVHIHTARDPSGRPYNFVHRDISPSNVMVSFSGDVKLIDFGLVKEMEQITVFGNIKGKFPYMAPEHFTKHPIDQRTDLFAFSSLLYEMATRRKKFDANTDFGVMEKIRTNSYIPLQSAAPHLPEPFVNMIEKAAAYNPADRYASSVDMLRDWTRLPVLMPELRLLGGRQDLVDFMEMNFGSTVMSSEPLTYDMEETEIVSTQTFRRQIFMPLSADEVVTWQRELGMDSATPAHLQSQNSQLTIPPSPPPPQGYEPRHPALQTARPQSSGEKPRSALLVALAFGVVVSLTAVLFSWIMEKNKIRERYTVHLTINDKKAKVFLDGTSVKGPPWDIDIPDDGGPHKLKVTSKGKWPWSTTLVNSGQGDVQYKVTLKPRVTSVVLEPKVLGIKVKWQGRWVSLPIELKGLKPGQRLILSFSFKGTEWNDSFTVPQKPSDVFYVRPPGG